MNQLIHNTPKQFRYKLAGVAGFIIYLKHKIRNFITCDAADHGGQVIGPIVFLIKGDDRDRRQAEPWAQISMGNFDARAEAGSGYLEYSRINVALDELYHLIANQHRSRHAFRGQGSQRFFQQLRRGVVIPSGGVFTDNLTVAAFDGINDLPVDSRPLLPILRTLDC